MSWFDTTGFVNVAKSALKEAQKTIDKALDINEEDASSQPSTSSNIVKDESESFFSAWGIKGEPQSLSNIKSSGSQDSVASSLWGSFTGSFFENSKPSPSGDAPSDETTSFEAQEETVQTGLSTDITDKQNTSMCNTTDQERSFDDVKRRRRDPFGSEAYRHSYPGNRLSIISSESDKRSSDSVEVLGSASCTTSPDSDFPTSVSASSFGSGRRPVSASSPESVEVLPESDSLEILGSRSSSTSLSSPHDPSPCQEKRLSQSEATSPSDVEVVAEEEEDVSLADDSYASASASESTMTQATVLHEAGAAHIAMDSSIDSAGAIELASQRTDVSLSSLLLDSSTDTVYSESGRAGLQLPLTLKSSKLKSSQENVLKKIVPTPSKSDKDPMKQVQKSSPDAKAIESVALVTPLDSSGDGTLVESGSDDATRLSDSDGRSNQSGSGYVRSLLADAIGDEMSSSTASAATASPAPPSTSHHLSHHGEARLGSEQTSGHTSGDEQETTTSSDIEIMSSPNGDGSSTTSRQSPVKLPHRTVAGSSDLLKFPCKVKGHQRELSEASSGGSDDSNNSEVDKLLKRLSEVTELLESRESKLVTLSRTHAELVENHHELGSQLETAQQTLREESRDFMRRFSSLEKKFQQAIREKEALQKQLDQSRGRLSNQTSEAIREKDEIIAELRAEGEKLSRYQLQQSELIKKLRKKEKESDGSLKTLRDQVESLTGDVERLQRSLAAKEEVERSQIGAVDQLTARCKRLEDELASTRQKLEKAEAAVNKTQAALEEAQRNLAASKEREKGADERILQATQNAEEIARSELEGALTVAQRHKRQMMGQLDEMRAQLKAAEEEHSRRESDLLKRLEASEQRSETLAQQLAEATRPLLRQLQALQNSGSQQQAAWERQERQLSDSLAETQAHLAQLTNAERAAREELLCLRSKVSTTESKLKAAQMTAQHAQDRVAELQADIDRISSSSENAKASLTQRLEETQRQLSSVEHQLSVERAATEAERRRTQQLQEQLRDRDRERERERDHGRESPLPVMASSATSSPTMSVGRESISSLPWAVFSDDVECASVSGRSVYESVRAGHATSLLEGLQSQLKLREGEVHQLQWELSRREAQRCALTTELSELSSRVEDLETKLKAAIDTQEQLTALRTEYDALLQLYGEKLEEAQELRLDLQDVKDMYKAQIDQLLMREDGRGDSSAINLSAASDQK